MSQTPLIATTNAYVCFVSNFLSRLSPQYERLRPREAVRAEDYGPDRGLSRYPYPIHLFHVICTPCFEDFLSSCKCCAVHTRFGSRVSQYSNCDAEMVPRILNCSEGTQLSLLATAAVRSARDLIRENLHSGLPFRLMFVLNTDGEARDGAAAGELFKNGYEELRALCPQMEEARSFVLGIGNNIVLRQYYWAYQLCIDNRG